MRRSLSRIAIVFLFIFMLLSPKAVFNGASKGLLLWFQIILPTLFPFILISGLLLATDSVHYISQALGQGLCRLLHVTQNGSFAVITGFLCGYPMGAKIIGDLIITNRISKEEGSYLLSFCNNSSPVFILNYVVWKTLHREDLMFPSLLILLGTPLIMSFLFRKIHPFSLSIQPPSRHRGDNTVSWDLSMLDSCIMDAAETIVKVGGYILLFSVFLSLLLSSPWQPGFLHVLLPTLELTNGIALIGNSTLPFQLQYPAILALTSFGGFCAIAQTQCVLQKSGLPILPYIIEKLATALVTSLVALLYLYLV